MLKFFSRMERTRNFVLLVFAILMVASLVLFYAPASRNQQGDLAHDETAVAKVGSENVTVAELATQKENMNRLGRPIPAKFFLDSMIKQRIIRGEAGKLGLQATDAEVAGYIRRQNKEDAAGLPFDQTRYEQNVTEQFGSVASFEQNVRDQLSGQKVQAFLTSGVTVSEEEVLNDYKRKNTKFDLTYVPVSSADLAQTIKPSEEELKGYFEQHKKNFYINAPQKKIRYVFLNTSKIGEKLPISDEDLKAEFEKIPADKKVAGIQGQQIVLRVLKPEDDSRVLTKANDILAQARKEDGKISEEAFANLAKGQSEDPGTALNGGKIPGLIKENPGKPDDPYQRLLKMQPGEITEPISYQDRYYILRRGEEVPKIFEDAKKEIEVSLRNRRAYAVVAELAQKVSDRLKEVKDVQKVAEEFAAQANMNPKDMVRETGYVKAGDDVENIGNSPQFEEGIASLENQADVGDKIPIQNGFAIPMLVDKKEPRDAEFDEVKEKIAETVKVEQAKTKIDGIADQIATDAGSASGLSAAAQAKGLKAQDAKSFILGSPLGQGPSAATSEALEVAIYGLKQGEVTKTPIKIGDDWYVVGVNSREEANMEDFAKQRDQLIQTKLAEKRERVYQDYLASRRQEMEAKGDIKIYPDALAKIQDDVPAPGTDSPTRQINF
ncbi:MAG: peptidylprolyl isomerase [Pyrinomonadaceae bacterium]